MSIDFKLSCNNKSLNLSKNRRTTVVYRLARLDLPSTAISEILERAIRSLKNDCVLNNSAIPGLAA